MTPPPRERQRGVARGIGAALILSTVVLGASWWLASPAPLESRLSALATLLAVLGLCTGVAVGRVATLRFGSATDFDAARVGTESPATAQARAILINTAEQALIAALAGTALTLLSDRAVPVLAAMTGLFTAGRVLFWTGYARGAEQRALGFAVTFYPSMLVLVGVMVGLVV
ncbi:MAPEG family protein [Sphingomonas sp. Y38-1Y]|uniref:MAPEG family protein n=1 Tax=Sphingomonas sp. Y38-1Y TaxID=3078265 RepID=UPI0028E1DD8A|nr:MAPEG family protein [Sphingomonas sp. Y38-1Y]